MMTASDHSEDNDPQPACPYCKGPMPEKWLTCGKPLCRAEYERDYRKRKRGSARFKRTFGGMRT
jgi:hypothetical protein